MSITSNTLSPRILPAIAACALLLVTLDSYADSRMAMGAGPGGLPEVVVFPGVGAGPQSFLAFPTQSAGGVRVALGDIDGDGVSDLIAGSGSNGAVRVFSGASGTMLQDFVAFDIAAGGVFVAAGDVNGDGRADVIVGNGGASAHGHVKVFDGRTFDVIDSYFAYETSFSGGVRVAVGDVNGDGRADVITSPGAGSAPHVKVFSGVDHGLLREFFAFSAGFTGGVFVAAGDVNGDGVPDVIVAADAGSSPQVAVVELETLRVLGSFSPYAAGFQGGVRVAAGDVNGDGVAEIITGPGAGIAPQVHVYSALNFDTPSSFLAFAANFTNGISVAAPTEVDVLLRNGFE